MSGELDREEPSRRIEVANVGGSAGVDAVRVVDDDDFLADETMDEKAPIEDVEAAERGHDGRGKGSDVGREDGNGKRKDDDRKRGERWLNARSDVARSGAYARRGRVRDVGRR